MPESRRPGTGLAIRDADGVRSGNPLLVGTDLVVGIASRATRLALQVGGRSWGAGAAAGRVAASIPGVHGTGRLLGTAAGPLVADGRDARARFLSAAQDGTQRVLQKLVPGVVDALDLDALVGRVDINGVVERIDIDSLVGRIEIDGLVQRIEIDALVKRIDIDELVGRIDIDGLVGRIAIDALVKRIDIDELVGRIDIDALVGRIAIDELVQRIEIDELVKRIDIDGLVQSIDIDELVSRIDVNAVVQRVDVDAVVEETELGTIVARSTSGFASEALDVARSQTAGVDTIVSRVVNRVLRRDESEIPVGPPLLTGASEDEGQAESAEPADEAPGGQAER